MIRAIISPSPCWLINTWAPGPRYPNGIINCCACQNAVMACPPSQYKASTASCPLVSWRIVWAIPRISAAPTGGSTESFSHLTKNDFFIESMRQFFGLKLQRVQTVIASSLPKQILVRAYFNDRPTVQDHNAIRILNGRQPMSNHQCCSILH